MFSRSFVTRLRAPRTGVTLLLGLALLLSACGAQGGGPTSTATPTRTPAPTSTPVPCAAWRVVASPSSPTYPENTLKAVGVVSPTEAWAVGAAYTGGGGPVATLTERWDGSAWHVVSSPGSGYLNGVAALSSSDVWAVGELTTTQAGEARVATLVERWNGAQWSVVASSNPSAVYSTLSAVAAVSANEVWAVGAARSAAGATLPLIERWDGSAWRVVATPALAGVTESLLEAVAPIPETNQRWAVGYLLKGPRPAYEQALIERWDGSAWRVVASPTLPSGAYGSELKGVVALSATDAWAVGSYTASDHTIRAYIAHWDGSAWQTVAAPDAIARGGPLAVAAAGPHDVRAVGDYYAAEGAGTPQPLALRWSGMAWEMGAAALPAGAASASLSAVAVDGADGFWAVGSYAPPDGAPSKTLIERCS